MRHLPPSPQAAPALAPRSLAVSVAAGLAALAGTLLAPSALAQSAPPAGADAAPAATTAPRVTVQRFHVTGNTLLPAAQLDTLLSPFHGSRSLAELKQAAVTLQAAYRDAGYGGVIVYLPEQGGAAATPGTVVLAVMEGRFSRVVISGNQRDSEALVRQSLPLLAEGQVPQPQRLDKQIQMANENPARQVAVSLEPGAQPGEVEARVAVTEQPLDRWTLGLDNTGSAETGRLRANLSYQRAGLWGLDHVASFQFQTAPEKLDSVRVFSASYRAPLYHSGLTLDAFAAYSDVDGGNTSTVAGPLSFSGKGEVWGLRLGGALPRQGELLQRLAVGLDQRRYINNCVIQGLPAGACGTAGESVAVHPVTLDYQLQWSGELPLGLQLTLAHNIDAGGRYGQAWNYEAVRPGAKVDYTTLRLNASAQWALPGPLSGWALQARAGGQATGQALVPGEQFGLAGANAVRGYQEREIIGDQGLLGSLEVITPDWAQGLGGWADQFRLLAFADGGRVWNHLTTPCRNQQMRCTLASVGLGARLVAGPFSLRLDLAHTLKAGSRTERHDQHLHLQATYSFQ